MKRAKTISSILVLIALLLSGCMPEAPRGARKALPGQNSSTGNGGSGGGQNAGPGDSILDDNLLDTITDNGKVELRHIIDPETRNYRTKVTIPKNFGGYLFLSGLNVSSLSNRLI